MSIHYSEESGSYKSETTCQGAVDGGPGGQTGASPDGDIRKELPELARGKPKVLIHGVRLFINVRGQFSGRHLSWNPVDKEFVIVTGKQRLIQQYSSSGVVTSSVRIPSDTPYFEANTWLPTVRFNLGWTVGQSTILLMDRVWQTMWVEDTESKVQKVYACEYTRRIVVVTLEKVLVYAIRKRTDGVSNELRLSGTIPFFVDTVKLSSFHEGVPEEGYKDLYGDESEIDFGIPVSEEDKEAEDLKLPLYIYYCVGCSIYVVDAAKKAIAVSKTDITSEKITAILYHKLKRCVIIGDRLGVVKVFNSSWEVIMDSHEHNSSISHLFLHPVVAMGFMSIGEERFIRGWSLNTLRRMEAMTMKNITTNVVSVPTLRGFASLSTVSLTLWVMKEVYHLVSPLGSPTVSIQVTSHSAHPAVSVVRTKDNCIRLLTSEGRVSAYQLMSRATNIQNVVYSVKTCSLYTCLHSGDVVVSQLDTGRARFLSVWNCKMELMWKDQKDTSSPITVLALYEEVPPPKRAERTMEFEQEHGCNVRKDPFDDEVIMLFGGRKDGLIAKINLENGNIESKTEAHRGPVSHIIIDKFSHQMISCGKDDYTIRLWRVFPYSLHPLSPIARFSYNNTIGLIAFCRNTVCLSQEPVCEEKPRYGVLMYNISRQVPYQHDPQVGHAEPINVIIATGYLNLFATFSEEGWMRLWSNTCSLLLVIILNNLPKAASFAMNGNILMGIGRHLFSLSADDFLPKELLKYLDEEETRQPEQDDRFQPVEDWNKEEDDMRLRPTCSWEGIETSEHKETIGMQGQSLTYITSKMQKLEHYRHVEHNLFSLLANKVRAKRVVPVRHRMTPRQWSDYIKSIGYMDNDDAHDKRIMMQYRDLPDIKADPVLRSYFDTQEDCNVPALYNVPYEKVFDLALIQAQGYLPNSIILMLLRKQKAFVAARSSAIQAWQNVLDPLQEMWREKTTLLRRRELVNKYYYPELAMKKKRKRKVQTKPYAIRVRFINWDYPPEKVKSRVEVRAAPPTPVKLKKAKSARVIKKVRHMKLSGSSLRSRKKMKEMLPKISSRSRIIQREVLRSDVDLSEPAPPIWWHSRNVIIPVPPPAPEEKVWDNLRKVKTAEELADMVQQILLMLQGGELSIEDCKRLLEKAMIVMHKMQDDMGCCLLSTLLIRKLLSHLEEEGVIDPLSLRREMVALLSIAIEFMDEKEALSHVLEMLDERGLDPQSRDMLLQTVKQWHGEEKVGKHKAVSFHRMQMKSPQRWKEPLSKWLDESMLGMAHHVRSVENKIEMGQPLIGLVDQSAVKVLLSLGMLADHPEKLGDEITHLDVEVQRKESFCVPSRMLNDTDVLNYVLEMARFDSQWRVSTPSSSVKVEVKQRSTIRSLQRDPSRLNPRDQPKKMTNHEALCALGMAQTYETYPTGYDLSPNMLHLPPKLAKIKVPDGTNAEVDWEPEPPRPLLLTLRTAQKFYKM